MGLEGEQTTDEILRAGVLLSQLPMQARTVAVEYPDASWSLEAQILRRVDYDLRAILYALGDGKGEKPKPIELPSERAKHDEIIDETLLNKEEVDEILSSIFPIKTQ